MKKRRMLVTGVAGMVGSYVEEVFHDYDLVMTDRVEGFDPLDVCDPAAVTEVFVEARPDIVLHLAAATDVDRCEQEPDWAYHTNAIGTQNLALACQMFDVQMVYISTAGVFWGSKPEPYIEFDVPRPANVYGQSKLAGEQIVSSLLQRYYVVRAGWMIGGGEKDNKFVGKIARLISDGKNPLNVVNDKLGSPTYGKDLLNGIRTLIDTGFFGLYHMVNEGTCSRYEVALAVRDILRRPEVHIVPVSSALFPLPALRARSEMMRNLKLDLLGLKLMRGWQDALREYVLKELRPALSSTR